MRNGELEVLANAYGENTTASVVAFREDGAINVGNAAKANIIHNPKRTVHSSKRLIGRYFFSEEVKKAQAICSYEIVDAENHALRIQIEEERFSLPEIAAMILSEMKSIAEARLGQPVTKAVITVPAYFNDNQRQATKDAGRIAGLEVLRILNEPTAAAVAYGFGKGLSQRVAVWDLGGGTFDISVLEIGEDVFEVLSTSGDTFLGGEDFDDRLIDLLADEFVAKTGINLRNDLYALEKLKVAAEGAKKGLSVESEVEIRIPDVIRAEDGTVHSIERTLTSEEYSVLVNDLIKQTFKVCDEALQQAGVVARDLDGVILVGGPTRLPIIRETVREYFQQEPKGGVDPDEVVAKGAAIHAASLVNPEQEAYLLDVTPLSLRIGIAGGLAETVIERNTPVPIEQTRTFTTLKDMQESVEIRIYQGESQEAEENELLGQFSFADFAKAARGEVQIDVTFEINTDGIVNVTAMDRATGQAASTRITLSSGLSEGEIDEIIDDARTDRVEPTTVVGEEGQVLGAIPLVSVQADTPVVFEETRESKEQLLDDTSIIPVDEEEVVAAVAEEVPIATADEDPPVAAIVEEVPVAPVAEEVPVAPVAEEAPVTPVAVEAAVAPTTPMILEVEESAAEESLPEVIDDDPNTDEMEAYVDDLPDDALDLDPGDDAEELELLGADEEPEELDLLDADEADIDAVELDETVEATDDDELELTESVDLRGPDPATVDTEPVVAKDELFEAPGTDLSTLEGGDSEETR
jgi:molecular chaperone DnaK